MVKMYKKNKALYSRDFIGSGIKRIEQDNKAWGYIK